MRRAFHTLLGSGLLCTGSCSAHACILHLCACQRLAYAVAHAVTTCFLSAALARRSAPIALAPSRAPSGAKRAAGARGSAWACWRWRCAARGGHTRPRWWSR